MSANSSNELLRLALEPFRDIAMFEGYELTIPESPGSDGDTPLHVAAMDGRLDQLKLLLPFVSNINVQGDIGNSPLHYAVIWDKPEMARELLRAGGDIHLANDYGDTPSELMRDNPRFDDLRRNYS